MFCGLKTCVCRHSWVAGVRWPLTYRCRTHVWRGGGSMENSRCINSIKKLATLFIPRASTPQSLVKCSIVSYLTSLWHSENSVLWGQHGCSIGYWDSTGLMSLEERRGHSSFWDTAPSPHMLVGMEVILLRRVRCTEKMLVFTKSQFLFLFLVIWESYISRHPLQLDLGMWEVLANGKWEEAMNVASSPAFSLLLQQSQKPCA